MVDFKYKDLIQDDKFLNGKMLLINKNNKKVKVRSQEHRNSQVVYFITNYKKILFDEEIWINERIRDITFFKKQNAKVPYFIRNNFY